MRRIAVTGGSGKAGRAVVRDLLEHGYEVVNVDVQPPDERPCPTLKADLTDLGQAVEALRGVDGVVHLAAIPAPRLQTDEVTFRTNVTSTYNVFTAATIVRAARVVWASSETTLGLPFENPPPAYVPVDEEAPLWPNSSYALSKVLGEEMARQFHRWSGLPSIGLRFSNVIEPSRYAEFPSFWDDPHKRKWNLWGYVDCRDVAQACRLALTADIHRADVFIIAAADTVMNRPSRELMREVFPRVPVREGLGGFDTLLSIAKAQARLSYAPAHSWRAYVQDAPR
ncbi:MAG: NAD(P)-dependent oxidoreductase [Chloroflexi bacterium]|nr:NAD(P)-dependent oxidoreductase [Chloroflexota bacterium]